MREDAGPVLQRELLTRLRTTRAFLVLFIFNAAVGAVILLGWSRAEAESFLRAEVGETLFFWISVTQIALVTLIAPALSSGSITLERELGTLDLLRATPITGRRLLLEKLLAAVTFFGILLVTSLPLMTLSFLLGGVKITDVLSIALSLLILVGVCGIVGVGTSTWFLRTQSSLAVTYILILPLGAMLALVLRGAGYDSTAFVSGGIGIGVLLVGPFLVGIAERFLEEKEEKEVEPDSLDDVAIHAGLLLDRRAFPDRLVWPARRNALIPDGTNPILEKDLRMESPGWSGKMISILIQAGVYLALPVMMIPPFLWRADEGGYQPILGYSLYLLGFLLLIGPAFSATSFSSERERLMMDLLASTPLSPWRVVGAKAMAALRGSLGFLALLVLPFGIFVVFAARHVDINMEKLAIVPIYFLILVLTAASITFGGLWISLRSRTSLSAMVLTYAVVAFLVVLPAVAIQLLSALAQLEPVDFRLIAVLSPITAMLSAGGVLQEAPFLLDPQGVVPIWLLFLLLWGSVTPFLALGAYGAYRRCPTE